MINERTSDWQIVTSKKKRKNIPGFRIGSGMTAAASLSFKMKRGYVVEITRNEKGIVI